MEVSGGREIAETEGTGHVNRRGRSLTLEPPLGDPTPLAGGHPHALTWSVVVSYCVPSASAIGNRTGGLKSVTGDGPLARRSGGIHVRTPAQLKSASRWPVPGQTRAPHVSPFVRFAPGAPTRGRQPVRWSKNRHAEHRLDVATIPHPDLGDHRLHHREEAHAAAGRAQAGDR